MSIKIKRQLIPEEREKLKEYSDIEAHLLFHRGITDSKNAFDFINPNYDVHSHSPSLFKDIDKAVERTKKAIKSNEKICIYADYDADGIPGAVILSDTFEKLGYKNFFVYMPHRNREGFGLNFEAIDKIKENNTALIITIDCGSSDVAEIEYANSLGMDVIITDHHEVPNILPKAYAIVNPKQSDCEYPEKMLCGCSVAYKFIQHLLEKIDHDIYPGWEKWLLDMVGIATISDMVPLVGENRLFAFYGLEVLKKTRRPGLITLFSLKKINQKTISEDDISFLITPQINAASRMGEPVLAFNLLKSKTEQEADIYAKELAKINNKRKIEVTKIVKEVHKHIKEKGHTLPVIAYGNPNWQPSLMGLVCSKIAEEYKKPVFLWGRGDGVELKGSCRTWGDIDVYDLMKNLDEDFFIQCGGHSAAGGFVIAPEKVSFLEDSLCEYVTNEKNQEHTYICDIDIHVDDVNVEIINSLEKISPYGIQNEKPVCVIQGEVLSCREFGAGKNHFEITLKKSNNDVIRAIAFFKTGDSFKKINPKENIKIIGYLEKNFFAGRHVIQIKLIDVL